VVCLTLRDNFFFARMIENFAISKTMPDFPVVNSTGGKVNAERIVGAYSVKDESFFTVFNSTLVQSRNLCSNRKNYHEDEQDIAPLGRERSAECLAALPRPQHGLP